MIQFLWVVVGDISFISACHYLPRSCHQINGRDGNNCVSGVEEIKCQRSNWNLVVGEPLYARFPLSCVPAGAWNSSPPPHIIPPPLSTHSNCFQPLWFKLQQNPVGLESHAQRAEPCTAGLKIRENVAWMVSWFSRIILHLIEALIISCSFHSAMTLNDS